MVSDKEAAKELVAILASASPPKAQDLNTAVSTDVATARVGRPTVQLDKRHLVDVFRRVQYERPSGPSLEQATLPLAFAFPVAIVAITSDEFDDFLTIAALAWQGFFGALGALFGCWGLWMLGQWWRKVRPYKAPTPEQLYDLVCDEMIRDVIEHEAYLDRIETMRSGRRT